MTASFPAPVQPLAAITLRTATPDDALCIGVLGVQVFLDTYATDGIRPTLAREVLRSLSPDAIAERLALPATTFVLAETAGHLIGFAQLCGGTPHALIPDPAAAELERLYVQQRFQGQGVGARLLARAEAMARATGAPLLWLTAWVGNARALRFYATLGYEEIGTTWFEFEAERHENRLFRKRFAAAAATPDTPRSSAC